jgi:hypothetical protein
MICKVLPILHEAYDYFRPFFLRAVFLSRLYPKLVDVQAENIDTNATQLFDSWKFIQTGSAREWFHAVLWLKS